jgi:hypothetical protein
VHWGNPNADSNNNTHSFSHADTGFDTNTKRNPDTRGNDNARGNRDTNTECNRDTRRNSAASIAGRQPLDAYASSDG